MAKAENKKVSLKIEKETITQNDFERARDTVQALDGKLVMYTNRYLTKASAHCYGAVYSFNANDIMIVRKLLIENNFKVRFIR